jgi:hypothetical protein
MEAVGWIMKMTFAILGLISIFILAACSPGTEVQPDTQVVSRTATAEAGYSALPEDVPIHESMVNLKLAANDTYISYEALGTVEEITEFYRENLAVKGWEKRNNSNEVPIGGAITLLRSKEDANISITVQSIPDSTYVRILISVIRK